MQETTFKWPQSIFPQSKIAKRISEFDWQETTLGTIDSWTSMLKATISMMLEVSFPVVTWIGENRILFYNDAAVPYVQDDLATSEIGVGKPTTKAPGGHWTRFESMVDEVIKSGRSICEAYDFFPKYADASHHYVVCKFSLDPIMDEQGQILGVRCILVENSPVNQNMFQKDQDYLFLSELGGRMDSLKGGSVEAVIRLIGEYFAADRIGLADIIDNSSHVKIVCCHQQQQMTDVRGKYDLNHCHQTLYEELTNGNIFLENHVSRSHKFTQEQRKRFAEMDVSSVLFIPLLITGVLRGVLFIHYRSPRQWEESEIRFLRICVSKFWDVLTSIRSQEETERSERYYRNLVDSLDQAFMVIEFEFDKGNKPVDYKFVHVNAAFELQTGLQDVVGKTIKQIMPEVEPAWLANYGSVALTGQPRRFEEYNTGTARWYDVYAAPLEGCSGQVVVVFKDITEKKFEDDRKMDFLSMASHELKTPLTSLKAYIDICSRKLDECDYKNVSTMLGRADKQLFRMTTIINGFLNLNELEKGRLKFNKKVFDLGIMLEDVKRDAALVFNNYLFSCSLDLSLSIYSDREKLQQVIVNLINNAVKYSTPGTAIAISSCLVEDRVRISVSDQGIGISGSDQNYIFNRFYRVNENLEKDVSGFGIGLYVCKEIVHGLGGEIGLTSFIGEGSIFWVELPVYRSTERS
ncbi:ATP-binding protein [Sphingobacterium suaedae]|uniref:histidine kinase n=1 Tax=Sphingobacterium suaedae TaxID=1686402 RepID=A0ABW5KKS0_9SPHI